MLVFCAWLRTMAVSSFTFRQRWSLSWISRDFIRHLGGLSLNSPRKEVIYGETVTTPLFEEILGDAAPLLPELQTAYDQFMCLCVTTCFGLKMMPVKMWNSLPNTRELLSLNLCAGWGVPTPERRSPLVDRYQIHSLGILKSSFLVMDVRQSTHTTLSFSTPSVAHTCLWGWIWQDDLQSKRGRGSEHLLLYYTELMVWSQDRDGRVGRSDVEMLQFARESLFGIHPLLLGSLTC